MLTLMWDRDLTDAEIVLVDEVMHKLEPQLEASREEIANAQAAKEYLCKQNEELRGLLEETMRFSARMPYKLRAAIRAALGEE